MNQSVKISHLFNYAVIITKKNVERQYELAIRPVRFTKLSMLIILTAIISVNYFTIIGIMRGLGVWFFTFALGLIFIPLVAMIIKSLKTEKITINDRNNNG